MTVALWVHVLSNKQINLERQLNSATMDSSGIHKAIRRAKHHKHKTTSSVEIFLTALMDILLNVNDNNMNVYI